MYWSPTPHIWAYGRRVYSVCIMLHAQPRERKVYVCVCVCELAHLRNCIVCSHTFYRIQTCHNSKCFYPYFYPPLSPSVAKWNIIHFLSISRGACMCMFVLVYNMAGVMALSVGWLAIFQHLIPKRRSELFFCFRWYPHYVACTSLALRCDIQYICCDVQYKYVWRQFYKWFVGTHGELR